jgi:hypothetical protein
LIRIDGLDGATQARNLNEVDVMAADYVANMTDQEPGDVRVAWSIELPEEVRGHLAAAEASRRVEAEARQRAASESREAARALRSLGLSVREVGAALGMSHERAQQLLVSASSTVNAPRQGSAKPRS